MRRSCPEDRMLRILEQGYEVLQQMLELMRSDVILTIQCQTGNAKKPIAKAPISFKGESLRPTHGILVHRTSVSNLARPTSWRWNASVLTLSCSVRSATGTMETLGLFSDRRRKITSVAKRVQKLSFRGNWRPNTCSRTELFPDD
jgi:hypothetical protein